MRIETAERFLNAFEYDSISTWCVALRMAEEDRADHLKPDGPLEEAVSRLRKVWWHEGEPEQRKAVHEAAAALKFEIAEARKKSVIAKAEGRTA